MAKLRGAARKAFKEMIAPVTGKRDDEAVRLVLIDWMERTAAYHAKKAQKIHEEILAELERQQRIADSRAFRTCNHKQREARRNRIIERRRVVPSYVPPCIDLSRPVRIRGNRNGTGAAYRMVDGVAQRIE